MSRRTNSCWTGLLGFCFVLTVVSAPGLGQQPAKPVRVGLFVSGFAAEYASHDHGLIAGLRERGYIEGKNLTVERRYGQLDMQRIFGFAQELATMELDAIVTVCTVTTRAALSATSKTPIVMLSVSDPVGHGLATSLAQPGMNVTGRSNLSRMLVPKLLQVFHDAVPSADQFAILLNSHNPLHEPLWAEALVAARPLNVNLVRIDGHLPIDFDAAMERVLSSKAKALFVLPDDPPSLHLRPQLAAFAKKHRLPLVVPYGDVYDDNALLRYGEDLDATARLSATHIDKILHGARAADLPIEQPTRFVMVVNLKVARDLSITIPAAVLARADSVIE